MERIAPSAIKAGLVTGVTSSLSQHHCVVPQRLPLSSPSLHLQDAVLACPDVGAQIGLEVWSSFPGIGVSVFPDPSSLPSQLFPLLVSGII